MTTIRVFWIKSDVFRQIKDCLIRRFCPSLESKVLKFPGRTHQVWLEPEGLDSDLIYPNGLGCTMPEEYQQKIINLIPGLEKCRLVKPGYGVEYDFIDPRQLKPSLETLPIENLFLAGQINGTTGYEEAAAQGVIAGVNAGLKVSEEEPFIVARTEGYIGVLIDDLTTMGTNEPYRMFPSRAEFRVSLRADNADERLTEKGYKTGCVSQHRYQTTKDLVDAIRTTTDLLKNTTRQKQDWFKKLRIPISDNKNDMKSAYEALMINGVTIATLLHLLPEELGHLKEHKSLQTRIEVNARYSHVVAQQYVEMAEVQRDEQLVLPDNLDFMNIPSLSMDVRMKLAESRPYNIAAASRIPGITPAAIVLLLRYVKNKTPKNS